MTPPCAGTTENIVKLSRNKKSTIKLSGRPLLATSASGLQTCGLLHIIDRTNKLAFLVDTGAQISVLPPTWADSLRKQEGFMLSAVNVTEIATYGTCSLAFNLGLRRTFCWIFIIADIQKKNLGDEFLHHYGLLVDIAN